MFDWLCWLMGVFLCLIGCVGCVGCGVGRGFSCVRGG